MRLTGRQRRQLTQALLSAFPKREDLAMMLSFGLNEKLSEVAGGETYSGVVFNLIEWAQSQGRLEELVTAARVENPGNPDLRDLADLFKPPEARQPSQATAGSSAGTSPTLTQFVVDQHNKFLDGEAWRLRMSAAEAAVCRIELPAGQARGTGFLLAPDGVMTCYFVVSEVLEGRTSGKDIVLRFDYRTDASGAVTYPGVEYHLAHDWLIDSSPIEQLDYALLRVAGMPGSDPVDGRADAPLRGWLTVKSHNLEPGQPLAVIQHAQGEPRKIAIASNAIVAADTETHRVTYRINTEPGSSGAPCFNQDWELVAMHERRDPAGKTGLIMTAIAAQPKVQATLINM
jgi:hypothetical protein